MNFKFNISLLKIASILYLAFPLFIFFIGWFKLPISLFLCGLLGWGLALVIKNQQQKIFFEAPVFQIVILFSIVLFWLLISGAGGFGYQNHDYFKHNSLLKDLTDQTWPVSYNLPNGKKYLSHYLAYYLPGPALFYSLGWKYVNMANFIFTVIGVVLSVFWALRWVGKFSFWVLIIFIFGAGSHLFILLYQHGFNLPEIIVENIQNHKYLFWLNCLNVNGSPINNINFMSVSDMLYWGPQHAIACWLAMGILLNDWLDGNIRFSPFYVSLVAFWAPLVLIGIAPFLLYVLVSERFKGIFNIVNLIIAPIIFGVIALFLTSIKTNELIHHFLIHNRESDGISISQQIGAYLYFIVVEVLIWWVPSYLVLRKSSLKKYNQLFWLVLFVLLLVPFFRYGQWNDWCTRVSLPALYLLYLMMAMAIFEVKVWSKKIYLIAICVICSLSPIILMLSSLNETNYRIKWAPPKAEFIGDLPSASVGFPVEQFVADPNCLFYKYLAKTKN